MSELITKYVTKRNLSIVAAAVVFLLVIWLIWSYFIEDKKTFTQPPVNISAEKAKQEQWQPEIDTTGTISAFQGIMLKPEVSGRITKIYFDSGQTVKAGEPIIQIYPDIFEAQLKKAHSALELSKMEYDRGKKLLDKKVMSQQNFDQLNAQYEEAQSSVDELQAQLRQHNISAPFAGRLGLRRVSLGDHVSPGQPIVNLQQLDPIRIEFSIPEVYLGVLNVGQKVTVMPASSPNKTFTGEIYAFDSALDVQTRTIDARAKIPNKEQLLVPGIFAEVRLYAGQPRTVVVVPQTALVYDLSGTSVYKVEGDKVNKLRVTIGERRGNSVEIVSGLKAGTLIVTAGQIKLHKGVTVTIENPPAKAPTTTQKMPEKSEE